MYDNDTVGGARGGAGAKGRLGVAHGPSSVASARHKTWNGIDISTCHLPACHNGNDSNTPVYHSCQSAGGSTVIGQEL